MEDLHNSSGEACPDFPTLQAWHFNQLDAVYWSHLKLHVDACPHCQADLARVEETPPDPAHDSALAPAQPFPWHAGSSSEEQDDDDYSDLKFEFPEDTPADAEAKRLERHHAARAHLRLISTHGEVLAPAPEEPRPVPREAGPDQRTVGSVPPWLSPDGRPTGPLPPIRPPATHVPPAPGPPAPPRDTRPMILHVSATTSSRPRSAAPVPARASSPPVPWIRNPWLIGAVSALVSLVLLYPAWLGLVRLPAAQQRLEVASVPQTLEPPLILESLPAQQVPIMAAVAEPALNARQAFALLEVTVPKGPVGTRYELTLTEERRGALWNQMGTEVREGAVSLLISPSTLDEGRYLVKTTVTEPGQAPELWVARFQVKR